MKALDLFSCIGCHAIGFDRAGIETVGFCEFNPWRQERIAELFPGKPIHDDVRTFAGIPSDIVIGGPPCQATSVAAASSGKRTGATLWPEMLRIVVNTSPEWVVVEQPPGNAGWEAQVYSDLSGAGYHVGRFEFGACDIGAPFLRRRVFVVACTVFERLAIAWSEIPRQVAEGRRTADARGDWDAGKLASLPVDARSAGEFDRGPASRERREWIEALGDSNPPHMVEAIGRAIVAASQLSSHQGNCK
jgi:site-specific DNA-cytosine methylase